MRQRHNKFRLNVVMYCLLLVGLILAGSSQAWYITSFSNLKTAESP